MKNTSMRSLWSSITDLFKTIYRAIQEDQEKMDKLKAKHEIAEMDLNDEWSDSRGKAGVSWRVHEEEDEEIIGI